MLLEVFFLSQISPYVCVCLYVCLVCMGYIMGSLRKKNSEKKRPVSQGRCETPTIFLPRGQNIVTIYWPPYDILTSPIIMNSYDAFILTLPKAIPTRPGGQNIVQYFDPPSRYVHLPHLNNQWQSFVSVSYLLNKIYNYVKIILMIYYRVLIMLLFWRYQKLSQLHPSNNQWQSFVCSSYLLDKIY